LVIVSRPLDLQDLPNIADQWSLLGGLRRVNAPAFLKILRPPTVEGLRAEILSGYDIVHFDGHGSFGVRCPNCSGLNQAEQKECGRCECLLEGERALGYFAFEREDGKTDALAAEELAEIVMSAPEHPTKLVFLSACESAKGGDTGLQSVLLAKGVPAVLGMNESVTAKATMALAAPFYAGLWAGMTIIKAFETARPALKRLENGSELQKIPVLEGPGKEVKILTAKVEGKASFEAEPLFGLPEHEFVGDYIRGDPPRGRKAILSQAIDALQGGEKLVVLTGQGGIGKTVLAAEAARRLSGHYPGGIFWRSAADMERLGLNELLDAFAEVLGWEFRTLPLDAKKDRALNYLRNYNNACLLVVDNAEKIEDANLWRFLEGIPESCSALVTTRESLHREGKEIRVTDMEDEEAGRLFIIEARRRSPKWGKNLNEDEMNSLTEISSIMHGHPLAIKLTAALVGSRSLASIRDELRRNPPQEVLDRFDVSYADLTESQKELLGCLAVFSSSVTEDAIKKVCIKEDSKSSSNLGYDLGELVRKSFLRRVEVEVQDESGKDILLYRYRMHPLMRQYAASKTGLATQTYLSRAADFFLTLAKSDPSFDSLEHERENVLACVDWAYDMEEWKLVREYAWSVDSYLSTRGYWKEREELLHQAIRATQKLQDKKGVANTLHKMGNLAYATGDLDKARRLYRKSLKINLELGDQSGVSITLHQMAMMANATGDLEKAKSLYKESLRIKQRLKDRIGVAKTLHHMGIMAYDRGDLDKASRLYKRSLKIKQEQEYKSGVAKTLHQQGVLAYETGNLDEARRLYQESLVIKKELRDKRGEAITLHQMGNVANAVGNLEEASMLYQKSLKIKQELSDKRGVAITLHQIGNLAYAKGNLDEADRLYKESLKIRQVLGDKSGMAKTLHKMGNMAYDTGNLEEAWGLYQESLKIKEVLGEKSGIAKTLHKMGNMAYAKGNLEDASRLYKQSLGIKQKLGDRRGESITRHQMGNMAYDTGDLKEAHIRYTECLRIEQELEDKRGKAKTLHQLGNMAYAAGDLVEPKKLYQDSLNIELELEDKRGIAQSLHNLGILAFKNNDLKEARRMYEESLKIKRELKDKQGEAITLHQLGNMAYATGDLEEARRLYQESLKIDEELGDKQGMAITLAQSSLLEKKAGDLDKAREQMDLAKKIFLELNIPIGVQTPEYYERLEKKVR